VHVQNLFPWFLDPGVWAELSGGARVRVRVCGGPVREYIPIHLEGLTQTGMLIVCMGAHPRRGSPPLLITHTLTSSTHEPPPFRVDTRYVTAAAVHDAVRGLGFRVEPLTADAPAAGLGALKATLRRDAAHGPPAPPPHPSSDQTHTHLQATQHALRSPALF